MEMIPCGRTNERTSEDGATQSMDTERMSFAKTIIFIKNNSPLKMLIKLPVKAYTALDLQTKIGTEMGWRAHSKYKFHMDTKQENYFSCLYFL